VSELFIRSFPGFEVHIMLSHLLRFKGMIEKKNGVNIKCPRFDKEDNIFQLSP
jgi:hypothetical protein